MRCSEQNSEAPENSVNSEYMVWHPHSTTDLYSEYPVIVQLRLRSLAPCTHSSRTSERNSRTTKSPARAAYVAPPRGTHLLALSPADPHAAVALQQHADVVPAIADGQSHVLARLLHPAHDFRLFLEFQKKPLFASESRGSTAPNRTEPRF